jgi:hypothetical protein
LYWGYNVTFTNDFTIYYILIHPSIIPYPPFPHSWNSFNRSHFSIYTHLYILLPPYLPSYTLSPHPLPSHSYQPPHRIYSALLFSDVERKKEKERKKERRKNDTFKIAIQCVLDFYYFFPRKIKKQILLITNHSPQMKWTSTEIKTVSLIPFLMW